MSERIFVLYKLKEGKSREEYHQWLREEHFPWGRSLDSHVSVQGFSVLMDYEKPDEEPEWTNISVLDIESREQWFKDMQEDPDAKYQWEKWESFIEKYKLFFTASIRA